MNIADLPVQRIELPGVIKNPGAGDDLNVSYSRETITPAQIRMIRESKTEEVDVDFILNLLVAYGVEWNLKDRDGNPIPCTFEGFSTVPATVLRAVLDAITQDAAPNETSSDS